jgi:hypothetical protein
LAIFAILGNRNISANFNETRNAQKDACYSINTVLKGRKDQLSGIQANYSILRARRANY